VWPNQNQSSKENTAVEKFGSMLLRLFPFYFIFGKIDQHITATGAKIKAENSIKKSKKFFFILLFLLFLILLALYRIL
jgi:hypothetical protein